MTTRGRRTRKRGIPPTEVGGWFRSFLLKAAAKEFPNPTNGSWRIIQILPAETHMPLRICDRSSRRADRQDLNNPPTALVGVEPHRGRILCRKDLNHPPTTVGGILTRARCASSVERI